MMQALQKIKSSRFNKAAEGLQGAPLLMIVWLRLPIQRIQREIDTPTFPPRDCIPCKSWNLIRHAASDAADGFWKAGQDFYVRDDRDLVR